MKKRDLSLLFLNSAVTLLAQDSNINPFAVNNGAIPSKNNILEAYSNLITTIQKNTKNQ